MKTTRKSEKRGGARRGAGRPRGAKSKLHLEIEAIAQGFAESALNTLNEIALNGKVESARVAASVAILDRAGGKPRQALEVGGADGGPVEVSVRFIRE